MKTLSHISSILIVLISLTVQVHAQSIVISPDRLREGDGKPRDITLDANVAPGTRLTISVSYSSGPAAPATDFIPKFTVQDNSRDDKNPQDGKIRLVLPKAFEKIGVYLVEVEEPRTIWRLVYEANNSSYLRPFVEWLAAEAGSKRGSERKSARERIEELTKTETQEMLAIWMAPLPQLGAEINPESRNLTIRAAVMPSWSRSGNRITCSVWRNGKWAITTFTINRMGAATQLWQWNSRVDQIADFSPAWSPFEDAIAFVRLTPDQKSDIWILELDRNQLPKREVKFTDIGNVQAVLGWDKDLGLVFETKADVGGQSSWRQTWATRVGPETGAKIQPNPLSDAYKKITGTAPVRRTAIYAEEKDSWPMSALYEINSSGKRWPLLIGERCSYRWPTISADEKWLAFDFDCPR